LGKYAGRWCIMCGFTAEHLEELSPIIEKLQEDYPKQEWNIMNSRFDIYDFILCGFADDRDEAHKIGMALVNKHLPSKFNFFYWIKEINLLKYNVRKTGGSK